MTLSAHIATRKGLLVARKTNAGWRLDEVLHFKGAPISMTLHDPRSDYHYAAINHGHWGQKLHRSKDGGATWEEIAVPAYPPKPDDVPDIIDPNRKVPIPWSLQLIWSLETGEKEGQLWCGTAPGGLFVSYDQGDSWQLIESLWNRPERAKWAGGGYDWPGIHSICVDPRDRRRLAVALSCGGAWFSDDNGATWENRSAGMRYKDFPPEMANDPDTQDPHRMVRCPAAPDVLWIQHHAGIFRSTNNGGHWEQIENAVPSDFGFAVVVHPKNPDVAWFAPGIKDEFRMPVDNRFVVSRTMDGGQTFEVLSSGLPDPPAFHLVYRHGLDIDSTGETLIMASTTGSCWVSDNGGDDWTRLSAELPPIYSVRLIES